MPAPTRSSMLARLTAEGFIAVAGSMAEVMGDGDKPLEIC